MRISVSGCHDTPCLGGNAPLREGPDTEEGDTHDSRSAGKHHW